MIRRLAFLLPAGLAMLAGLDAALLLLGVWAPVSAAPLPGLHGILMVIGFVGTVIALERAVALRRPLGFASPALLGVGSLLLLSPVPQVVGRLLLVGGSAVLVWVYQRLWQRQREESVLVQALGGVLLTGGTLLWLGGVGLADLLPWLVGFIVLTIAGERLELARVVMLAGSTVAQLVGVSAAILAATTMSLLWPAVGYPVLGLAILALVLWFSGHDVARRTVRSTGLTRFMAVCLLAGYLWLAVTGAIWLVAGRVDQGFAYDAVVHAAFLGFTISMIFAHAPVILPAVLRTRLPYHPVMYLPAVLLHGGLVVRLGIGDAHGVELARQVGGVLNVIALLLFAAVSATQVVRGRARRTAPRTPPTPPGPPLATPESLPTATESVTS